MAPTKPSVSVLPPSSNNSNSDTGSSRHTDVDLEAARAPVKWSSWFGGPNVRIGPRIGPPLAAPLDSGPGGRVISSSDTDDSGPPDADKVQTTQLELEEGSGIKYRTCSWKKTAALLFSEYICLAIMSFPWSYSILGLVPGLIFTIVQALIVLYTSLILWQFCLRHPEVRDVCDIVQMLFGGKEWAWWATAVMFLLNNTFIQGVHVLLGAKYLNTMAGTGSPVQCGTVVFGLVVTFVSWLASLPRTFATLSHLGTVSAALAFVSLVLATVFAAVQAHPVDYRAAPAFAADSAPLPWGPPLVTALPLAGTTFAAGLGACLNISFAFIGQITLPSFIAEMKDPRDFPKALWTCTILEMIVFSVVGAVSYAYIGNQYMKTPAFGSLEEIYKKVAFSLMTPTTVFLGALYASVSGRFIFFRLFRDSRHKRENTVVGWTVWSMILFATWACAFIIANVIPFFSSLLSLMSSLFDSFFGFIFWGIAYFRMRKADGVVAPAARRWAEGGLNIFIILVGFFFLTCGTYVTVVDIIKAFGNGTVGSAFGCASNGI